MSDEVQIEQIRAARDITVALIDKALISFTEEELTSPRKLVVKIGNIYAGIYLVITNPYAFFKDEQAKKR